MGPIELMKKTQSTLQSRIKFSGIGLHSGRSVTIELVPAKPSTGIVFQRVDTQGALPVLAHAHNITATDLSTTIGRDPSNVGTIEHLMAAFSGLSIDNVLVRVDAPELPIMDGSSKPFVQKILEAGILDQGVGRRYLVSREAFEVRNGDRFIRLEPAAATSFHCTIEYPWKAVGRQEMSVDFDSLSFVEICGARTFCHLMEVNAMRKMGLALGGSLDNAVVVNEDGIENPDGLRHDLEFVQHKILDCIGDLALLGAPLLGKITLHKPGHALHAEFMREIMTRKDELLATIEAGTFNESLEGSMPTKLAANIKHL